MGDGFAEVRGAGRGVGGSAVGEGAGLTVIGRAISEHHFVTVEEFLLSFGR